MDYTAGGREFTFSIYAVILGLSPADETITVQDGVPGDYIPDMSGLSTPYFALQLAGGHVGLPILVLIFIFSRRVHRPASVVNFCLTWILYSVSYSLL